jgi:hypothetical protein
MSKFLFRFDSIQYFTLIRNLYTPIGAGNLFDLGVLRTVDNGMILRSGISKGVRIVKGNMGKPIPALVVDGK